MSTAFTTRRRAERFDALIADPAAGADDARDAGLLALVGELRAVPGPQPRADFAATLRAQLMVEADAVLLPQDRSADDRLALPARTARSPRDRRLAVAAGALALVGATTSMAVASQSALPGDTLYPVKRALEDVHAGVSFNDAARGSTLLANASGRLVETAELARIGDDETLAATPGALAAFTDQARAGSALLLADYRSTGDASSVATVRDFAGQSLAVLETLEGRLPERADDDLVDAAAVLTEIDREATDLCATCGGLGIAEIPPSLVSAATGDDVADLGSLSLQPVQPAQPLRPRNPATGGYANASGGSANASGGSANAGGGRSGGSDDAGASPLPDAPDQLPPGSARDGDQALGSEAGNLVRDLTGGPLGSTGSSGAGKQDSGPVLEETGKQLDQLLQGTGVDEQLEKGLDGTGLTGKNGLTGSPTGKDGLSGKNGLTGGLTGDKQDSPKASRSGGSGSGGSGSGTGGLLDGLLGD